MVPVVGADAIPAAAPTGAGYDGVARMTVPNGTFHNASLLSSGLHLVTTASAVSNTSTTILNGDYTLDFDLPSGRISIVVRYSASLDTIEFHPSWTGFTTDGNDVAVMAIPDQDNLNAANRFMIAPLGADRYLMYPLSNEIGKSFTVVGYGATGTGATGQQSTVDGLKRVADNEFGADGTGFVIPAALALAADFDDGTAGNDELGDGTGLGSAEGLPAGADGGAPALIGNMIAGLFSGFVDNGNSVSFDFGDIAVFTRGSSVAGAVGTSVDTMNRTGSGQYHLVLDLDYQDAGNDGAADVITLSAGAGPGTLHVNINGVDDPNDYLLADLLSFTVRGSGDDDTVIIAGDFNIPVFVDGQGGNNTLANASSLDKVWTIDGANSGAIDFTTPLQFSNMQNLTGDVLIDSFQFAAGGSISGNVDGGSGGDFLDFSAYNAPAAVNLATTTASGIGETFTNIVLFIGSNQQDTLVGENLASVWNLSASGNGVVGSADFTSFETLVGGALDDQFNVNFTAPTTAMALDGGAGQNAIQGPDANLVWQLTGAGAGGIVALNLSFNNMQDLTGGGLRDVFRIGQSGITSGQINGGGGTNWLDYSGVAKGISANLGSGAASRILGGVVGIQNLIGSARGTDKLVGRGTGSVVVGHGGGNTVSSGGGRDLLIGGLGRNTVNGGGGDDILIAGRTVFDADYDALEAILAIWKSAASYNARVAALRSGPNRLIVGQTVKVTQTINTQGIRPQYGHQGAGAVTSSVLRGQTGQDWFFTSVAANAVDRSKIERLN